MVLGPGNVKGFSRSRRIVRLADLGARASKARGSQREPRTVGYRPETVRRMLSVVVAAALVSGGCAGGGAASPSALTLDGRTFLSTNVQGRELVPGSSIRLTFPGGRIGISAGCNQMSGIYAVVDGHLRATQMMTTEMGCAPPLMAQDSWVGAFIDGATVALAGDTLTLGHGDVTMTLTDRVVADPDRPLEGTRWVVDGIVAGDVVSSVPAGVSASLIISNGRLQVQTGCNTGIASVEATATTVTIGPLTLTRNACARDATSVQQAVTSVLSGQVGYRIEAGVLSLTAAQAGLVLRAAR